MLTIIQVSAGKPGLLGEFRGRQVQSGIVKQRVEDERVYVGALGLEPDDQADKRVVAGKQVHGGPLKAVYAYPLDHLAEWNAELSSGVSPGISFGENLTVHGMLETDVRIGDEFRCGDVVLRVTSPRRPCYKLGLHLGEYVPVRMNQTGRCGWYFQVLSPGYLPTAGAMLELIASDPSAPTVAEAFAAKVRANPEIPGPPAV
ncbi:MAG TPA: MOSC domain-containing protein [Candidatus Saccharimonadales bacterium]|nr:MOSC domain-containing protein [Candidatus Saccharimonadales bacterium]